MDSSHPADCHGGTPVMASAGALPVGAGCVCLRTEQLFAG